MEKSEFLSAIRSTAKANGIWVSLGGMHRRPSPSAGNEDAPLRKVFNSHIIIDCSGEIRSIYDKLHLFSVNIEGGPRLDENSFSIPGELARDHLSPRNEYKLNTSWALHSVFNLASVALKSLSEITVSRFTSRYRLRNTRFYECFIGQRGPRVYGLARIC